jgi:hypothetical protein
MLIIIKGGLLPGYNDKAIPSSLTPKKRKEAYHEILLWN